MEDSKPYWFPAKRYGWGWGLPCHWKGWLTLASYIVVISVGAYFLQPDERLGAYIAMVALCTVALLAICWVKGERPRWRWG